MQGPPGPAGLNALVNVSWFSTSICPTVSPVTTSYQKLADLGTFTTLEDSSIVDIEFRTHMRLDFDAGTSAAIFQLRVNDLLPAMDGAALVRGANGTVNHTGTTRAIFDTLAAGEHTLSVWLRANSPNVSSAQLNPGCFSSSFGGNSVFVREYSSGEH